MDLRGKHGHLYTYITGSCAVTLSVDQSHYDQSMFLKKNS